MTHPTRRYLFTVDVNAKGKLFYSVAGTDEVVAFESLKAGDQNCMLIYEDIEVLRSDPPATPVCLGLDPQFRRHRNV
jgi:hypothetical protein